jgi:hypothetical protein
LFLGFHSSDVLYHPRATVVLGAMHYYYYIATTTLYSTLASTTRELALQLPFIGFGVSSLLLLARELCSS